MPKTAETKRGLYSKYVVERCDDPSGKHAECEFFVLDPAHDPAAYSALRHYANIVGRSHPSLASDLHAMCDRAADALTKATS